MTESKAYPTMINGMPTMAMRIELFTFMGLYNRFSFSLKMFILSDSFNSKDKLFHSRIVWKKGFGEYFFFIFFSFGHFIEINLVEK